MSRHSKISAFVCSIAALLSLLGESKARAADIDLLPILTLDVAVEGCSDSARANSEVLGTISNNIVTATLANGQVKTFDIWAPPGLIATNQTRMAGVRIAGVNRLGDIAQLDIQFWDYDCVKRIALLFNNEVLSSFETGQTAPSVDPWVSTRNLRYALENGMEPPPGGEPFHIVWDGAVLQDIKDHVDVPHMCSIPRSLSGKAIERTVAGMFGDAVWEYNRRAGRPVYLRTDDAVWVTKASASNAITVHTRFHTSDAIVTLEFGLAVRCGPLSTNPQRAAISFDITAPKVTDIDGNFLAELADFLGLVRGEVEGALSGQLDHFREQLSEAIKPLPLCPALEFAGAEGAQAPDLLIGVPDLSLLGVADDMCI